MEGIEDLEVAIEPGINDIHSKDLTYEGLTTVLTSTTVLLRVTGRFDVTSIGLEKCSRIKKSTKNESKERTHAFLFDRRAISGRGFMLHSGFSFSFPFRLGPSASPSGSSLLSGSSLSESPSTFA